MSSEGQGIRSPERLREAKEFSRALELVSVDLHVRLHAGLNKVL